MKAADQLKLECEKIEVSCHTRGFAVFIACLHLMQPHDIPNHEAVLLFTCHVRCSRHPCRCAQHSSRELGKIKILDGSMAIGATGSIEKSTPRASSPKGFGSAWNNKAGVHLSS